jgi:PKD repeat protein
MLYNEIDCSRPVFYSGGTDKRVYHAFICDGYQGNYFHFNFGGGWAYAYLDKMLYHNFQNAWFNNQPVAHFKVEKYKNYSPPDTVHFIDLSVDHPVSWKWDFGDGTKSTEKDPTHIYANPGSYTVKLTITTDSNVVYTRTRKNCINISKVGFRKTDIGLPFLAGSASDWGDYDNDGDLDLIICGLAKDYKTAYTKIYRNDGNGTFTDINDSIIGVGYFSSVAWGDYDNDGDLDFIECGKANINNKQQPATLLYKNKGNDQFKLVSAHFTGFYFSDIKWGDLNNDGLLDLVISGATEAELAGTEIYKNMGNGQFKPDFYVNNVNWVKYATIALADYDNDGDLDIAFSGMDYRGDLQTYLLNNDGDFHFKKVYAPFKKIYEGNLQWGDYDNDGDLDMLVMGNRKYDPLWWTPYPYTGIYQNNNNQFSKVNAKIDSLDYSRAYCGDYDNDGLLDFIIACDFNDKFNIYYSEMKLYHNEGNNKFVCYNNSLEGLAFGNVYFIDYNNDGSLDIFANGRSARSYNWSDGKMVLYTSLSRNKNKKPNPPGNLSAVLLDNNTVKLSWSRGKDDHTPSKGLSYNIFIGSTPDSQEIFSSMSNLKNGKRQIASIGNVCQDTSWTIYNLKGNQTYYWSVQSIDGSYQGSVFAPVKSFTTTNLGVRQSQEIDKLITVYPNPVSTNLYIELKDSQFKDITISIYDLSEKLLFKKHYNNVPLKTIKLNLLNYNDGIYFVRIKTNKGIVTRKFVVSIQ